eukprot:11709111-Ditylum_brightwellii.AAC.1
MSNKRMGWSLDTLLSLCLLRMSRSKPLQNLLGEYPVHQGVTIEDPNDVCPLRSLTSFWYLAKSTGCAWA